MRKSKQKFTLTQTALILTALGAVGGTANAQWAVTNVNDPIYFGPTGIFTQVLGHMINSSKAATDQNSALSEIGRKQNFQLQEDGDQRARLATGQAAVAEKLSKIRPTLEACAQLSDQASKAPAARTSAGGSGAAGGKPAPKTGGRRETLQNATQSLGTLLSGPRSQKEAVALIVETRKALDTCQPHEITAEYGGCKGATEGKFSGSSQVPPSDISPVSLFGNTNNQLKGINKDVEFANRSISASEKDPNKTIEVSRAYINNLLTNGMPTAIDPKKANENPEIMAQYRVLQQRIESTYKPLRDILSLTIAPENGPDKTTVAGKHWEEAKANYEVLFGTKAPEVPSMRDLILYQVTNDYVGIPKNTKIAGDEILLAMNERMALSNYLAFKQLEATENTNVLLATLNVNVLNPFDYKGYINEINKVENKKVGN